MRRLTLIVGLLHYATSDKCIDFVTSPNIYFKGDNLKVIRVSRGQFECEEECRKLIQCKAYSMTRQKLNQKCFLKKMIPSGQGFSERSSHRLTKWAVRTNDWSNFNSPHLRVSDSEAGLHARVWPIISGSLAVTLLQVRILNFQKSDSYSIFFISLIRNQHEDCSLKPL